MKKKVYIAYTGGTIGMRKTDEGYAPECGYLAEQMAAMPELQNEQLPEYTIHEYPNLLDSANMTPKDWLMIAQDIAKNYNDYDGFIVLHGTDTMAYTSSALTFMLDGLEKPVILTGSQIPLCEVRNDARENIISAMMFASHFAIPEVCLYFANHLFRGCRSTKIDADRLQAFASPNFPALGTSGIKLEVHWENVRSYTAPRNPLKVREFINPAVGVLRLFPGISPKMVENMLQPPIKGIVLEAFGIGNGPGNNPEFLKVLKEATDRGIVIVNCSQCLHGTVNMHEYSTGNALSKAGLLSGHDMTTEAALAKMFALFSTDLPVERIKELIQEDLRGELTPLSS